METPVLRRLLVVVSSFMVLAGAGCATKTALGPSRGCGAASAGVPTGAPVGTPGTANDGALPGGVLAISAVPGTRTAWAVGDRVDPELHHHGYLLRFSGAGWVKAAAFRPWVHLAGVSALSGSSAWVWAPDYLALVSGGIVRRLQAPWMKSLYIADVASDGTANTWVAGRTLAGTLVMHWDGRSWRRTALPAGSSIGPPLHTSMSTDGPASAWMVVGTSGDLARQWVLHWNGRAWSRSYMPPKRLYGGRYNESGPDSLSVAGSGGKAWVVYTEERVPKGEIAIAGSPSTVPTSMLSAYFDGSRWSSARVSAPVITVSEVAVSGSDAWAIGYQSHAILCSHLGGPWQRLPVPRMPHRLCALGLQLDISPPYLIQTTDNGLNNCAVAYGYVYDGRGWRPVRPG
jgi:hypothetical protein